MTKIAASSLFAAFLFAPIMAFAQAEPPIRSPQDAACRNEARARVFSGAIPPGGDLRSIGASYYFACMRRTQAAVSPAKSKVRSTKAKRANKAKRSRSVQRRSS